MSVYIIGAKRTAIGSFLGSLKDISAAELGTVAIQAALTEAGVAPAQVDEVIIGNVISSGQKQGVARQAAIHAGIPVEVPAYAINMVCGSGMKAVMTAFTEIKAGQAELVVAGGVESMSQAPFIMPGRMRQGQKMGAITMVDTLLEDALLDSFDGQHMGITAENVAEKHDLSRVVQDEFAFASQTKAIAAVDSGAFVAEIAPVTVKTRQGEVVVATDEYPNRTSTLEKLAKLRPAFKKEGTVTAGNASGINDGGSATVIASEAFVKEHELTPLVEIVAIGQGGVSPEVMGLGPVPAIQAALKQAHLTLEEIDILELNEAFAAQSLGVLKELGALWDVAPETIAAKTNLNGGAIALGHPLGASGNRIIVSLIHLMKAKNLQYGLASLCIGGGMGVAVILKNVN